MTDRKPKTEMKPVPPHPTKRRTPLPLQVPKSDREDSSASIRISAITHHPNYQQAESDLVFMHRDETRGVRLLLDFMKPETVLEEEGIRHSIVVFGSTRIPEPSAAADNLKSAQEALKAAPDNADLKRNLRVAERIEAKSQYYNVARNLGRIIGDQEGPHGRRLVIVTGGGPGIMEAANRGASDSGARSVGLNITLPYEQFPNPYVTPGLCFKFHYFGLRKLHFLLRARALVVFPGGFGTLDELFETLTLIQTRKIKPVPVILVGQAFWKRAFDPDFLVEEGVIDKEDLDLFWFAETAEEVWNDIQNWYERAGEPVVP